MTVGELIRKKRKELGMTLDDVGRYCGVDRSYVLKWETGAIQKIRSDRMVLLSQCLQIDIADLIATRELLTKEERRIMDIYRTITDEGREYLLTQAEIAVRMYGKAEET